MLPLFIGDHARTLRESNRKTPAVPTISGSRYTRNRNELRSGDHDQRTSRARLCVTTVSLTFVPTFFGAIYCIIFIELPHDPSQRAFGGTARSAHSTSCLRSGVSRCKSLYSIIQKKSRLNSIEVSPTLSLIFRF